MGRVFQERLTRFSELPKVPAFILVLLLLVGSWTASDYTGGTKHAYPHLFYVPILLGAYFFRVPGAWLTAAAAGILAGLMPLDVDAGIAQPLGLWLFRMGFFLLIGLLTAVLFPSSTGALPGQRADGASPPRAHLDGPCPIA